MKHVPDVISYRIKRCSQSSTYNLFHFVRLALVIPGEYLRISLRFFGDASEVRWNSGHDKQYILFFSQPNQFQFDLIEYVVRLKGRLHLESGGVWWAFTAMSVWFEHRFRLTHLQVRALSKYIVSLCCSGSAATGFTCAFRFACVPVENLQLA
jgi:hypothetical protein